MNLTIIITIRAQPIKVCQVSVRRWPGWSDLWISSDIALFIKLISRGIDSNNGGSITKSCSELLAAIAGGPSVKCFRSSSETVPGSSIASHREQSVWSALWNDSNRILRSLQSARCLAETNSRHRNSPPSVAWLAAVVIASWICCRIIFSRIIPSSTILLHSFDSIWALEVISNIAKESVGNTRLPGNAFFCV